MLFTVLVFFLGMLVGAYFSEVKPAEAELTTYAEPKRGMRCRKMGGTSKRKTAL